jgi:antitoxin component YwqK of YwqJK toxin-antitoxin module
MCKFLVSFFLVFPIYVYSQDFHFGGSSFQKLETDSSFYKSILDSVYGINKYESFNPILGGDSIRIDKNGYPAMGWVKDYYPSEALLHRGFYSEGKLKMYKNYFPNGQIERVFKSIDGSKSTIEKYFSTGVLKSEVVYLYGASLKWKDYYPSGKLEYLEEYHKSQEHYIIRQTFYESGKIETNLELIKPKKLLYKSEEFSKNGGILKAGELLFSETLFDYVKIGKWDIYNLSGKLIKEEFYINGKLNKENFF